MKKALFTAAAFLALYAPIPALAVAPSSSADWRTFHIEITPPSTSGGRNNLIVPDDGLGCDDTALNFTHNYQSALDATGTADTLLGVNFGFAPEIYHANTNLCYIWYNGSWHDDSNTPFTYTGDGSEYGTGGGGSCPLPGFPATTTPGEDLWIGVASSSINLWNNGGSDWLIAFFGLLLALWALYAIIGSFRAAGRRSFRR